MNYIWDYLKKIIYIISGFFTGFLIHLWDLQDHNSFLSLSLESSVISSNPLGAFIQTSFILVMKDSKLGTIFYLLLVILCLLLFFWFYKSAFKTLFLERYTNIISVIGGVCLSFIIINKGYNILSISFGLYSILCISLLMLAIFMLSKKYLKPKNQKAQYHIDINNPINWGVIDTIRTHNPDYELFTTLQDNIHGFYNTLKNANVSTNSYTVCIDGSWGSGKSSFINLIKDCPNLVSIEYNPNDYIWIEDFNPWNFGNSSELIKGFFDTLSLRLDQDANLILTDEYQMYVKLVTKSFEEVGFPLNLIAIFKKEPELTQIKELIKQNLQKSSKKIVFVLDDIDRMSGPEILELIRLVKVVADFPNIIFVLSMDYDKVKRVIIKETHEEFDNYLQKIVQQRIKVADYSYEDLESIFIYLTQSIQAKKEVKQKLIETYCLLILQAKFRDTVDLLEKDKKIVIKREVGKNDRIIITLSNRARVDFDFSNFISNLSQAYKDKYILLTRDNITVTNIASESTETVDISENQLNSIHEAYKLKINTEILEYLQSLYINISDSFADYSSQGNLHKLETNLQDKFDVYDPEGNSLFTVNTGTTAPRTALTIDNELVKQLLKTAISSQRPPIRDIKEFSDFAMKELILDQTILETDSNSGGSKLPQNTKNKIITFVRSQGYNI